MIVKVYIQGYELGWIGERLAPRQEFESLWNRGRGQYLALSSGEVIQLAEGVFRLDRQLEIQPFTRR